MKFDPVDFTENEAKTNPGQIANIAERVSDKALYEAAMRVIALGGGEATVFPPDIFAAMRAKKDDAVEGSSIARPRKDVVALDQYDSFGDPKSPLAIGSPLTEEDLEMLKQVEVQVAQQSLETYCDAYMSPFYSDMLYRLGPVTGTYVGGKHGGGGAVGLDGSMYTRAAFSVEVPMNFWNSGSVANRIDYYAALGFPPFKAGKLNDIADRTSIMAESKTPGTFDQDRFRLAGVKSKDGDSAPTGFTYRDPGFKQVNDHVSFIQFITERVTGVVSTYLSEWDLSLYFQENLLTMEANGGAGKIWLNYRIRQDNPLANEYDGYDGDRALAFNVCGSAVSKADFDYIKPWRPSDYPLSCWWLPYRQDKDWKVKTAVVVDTVTPENEEESERLVYYPSWADENPFYTYEGAITRDAMRHDDFVRMTLSEWSQPDMLYYQAFYRSNDEGFSTGDILSEMFLSKVLGADSGYATSINRDARHLRRMMRDVLIDSGGCNGAPSAADEGNLTGLVKRYFNPVEGGSDWSTGQDGSPTTDKMVQSSQPAASVIADVVGKPDAASMADYTGLNRFSPALYGGPHGACYSPNTVQGYFEAGNEFLRDTPRVMGGADVDGVDSNVAAFQKALSIRKEGIKNWTVGLAVVTETITKLIEGSIKFSGDAETYDFPKTVEGSSVEYVGGYQFEKKTTFQPDKMWKVGGFGDSYYSYENDKNKVMAFKNGEWGWETTSRRVFRVGKFTRKSTKPYKKYLVHDEPDAEWFITTQKFLEWKADPTWDGPYWSFVRKMMSVMGLREKYPLQIKSKIGFRLTFRDQATENRVIDQMILLGQSRESKAGLPDDEPVTLLFCEGNVDMRYESGPECIFGADVYLKKWPTVQYVLVPYRTGINRTSYRREKRISFVPYLMVGINEEVPLFFDGLNAQPWTNADCGSSTRSVHLAKVPDSGANDSIDDVVKKFRGIRSDGTNDDENDYEYDEPDFAGGSRGTVGIRGIGILSKVQGYDPEIVETSVENFLKYLRKSGDFQTHYTTRRNAEPRKTSDGHSYYLVGGFPEYEARPMDDGLKAAVMAICSRAAFTTAKAKKEGTPPVKVGMDVPYRNLMSVAMTQLAYIQFAKKFILESLDFGVLRRMCDLYVDACVQKACGLSQGERVPSDPLHPLYNHWLARLVEMVDTPESQERTRSLLSAEFDRKIAVFGASISALGGPSMKLGRSWSDANVSSSESAAKALSRENKTTIVDEFLFGYLNLLYEYRKYFVCMRFNKKNGTMWAMRQLEATLNFLAPVGSTNNPPPSPAVLAPSPAASYKVAFYEIQNKTSDKILSFVIDRSLGEDKTTTVYVKVNWVGKEAYDRWLEYSASPVGKREVPEVVRILRGGRAKYAIKPKDGTYVLVSKELLDSEAAKKWNANNPTKPPKVAMNVDQAKWFVEWGDSPSLTPIRWNVFTGVDAGEALQYSAESITPEEFVCLAEQGADFWKVNIPKNLWPRSEGYRNEIRLESHRAADVGAAPNQIRGDPYFTVLGAQAYNLCPIAEGQERPVPGAASKTPYINTQLDAIKASY